MGHSKDSAIRVYVASAVADKCAVRHTRPTGSELRSHNYRLTTSHCSSAIAPGYSYDKVIFMAIFTITDRVGNAQRPVFSQIDKNLFASVEFKGLCI